MSCTNPNQTLISFARLPKYNIVQVKLLVSKKLLKVVILVLMKLEFSEKTEEEKIKDAERQEVQRIEKELEAKDLGK